ncbi:MAG: histidine phosphatase family protein [Rhodoglobus sp.]
MTYAFIRHGQTDWNRDGLFQGSSDVPLNDVGRQQALDAAATLRDFPWTAIVSSGLRRARETAEIIAGELGIELGPAYPELAERDYGVLEGTSADAAIARWPSREYPGAETIASVVERGRAGVARIAADYPGQDVVIVCHGTIIRYTLSDFAGRKVDGILNGSISTFRLDGDRWNVLSVNGQALAVADRI